MKATVIATLVLASTAGIGLPVGVSAAPKSGVCGIKEIAAFQNRIHILCDISVSQQPFFPRYLAVESSSPLAQHALTIAAMGALKKNATVISVGFDDNTALNPPGCLAHDCYRLTGVWSAPW